MKIREIYCKRWLLPKDIWGITLYPFIFYNTKNWHIQDFMRRHEWIHVEQIRRIGWFNFYRQYIVYNFKYGYRNNPFEKEAYERQYDETTPWS